MWRSSTSASTSTRCGGAPPRRSCCTGRARVLQADAALESYQRRAAAASAGRCSTPAFAPTIRTSASREAGSSRIAEIWDCTKRGAPRAAGQRRDRDGHGTHVAGIIAGRGTRRTTSANTAASRRRRSSSSTRCSTTDGEGEDAWIIKALDHIAEQNESNAAARDPRAEPQPRRPVRLERVRLRLHADLPGAAAAVALGRARGGGLRQRGPVDVQTSDGDVELNIADVDRRPGEPRGLHRRRLGQRRQAAPLRRLRVLVARPHADGRCKPDVVAPGERIPRCNARFTRGRAASSTRRERHQHGGAARLGPASRRSSRSRREFIGRPDEVKKLLLDTCTDIGRDRQHQGAACRT